MALAGKMGDIIAGKNIPLGITGKAKACDGCKVAAAALFCRTDSSYMCINCDTKIHGDDRYERVWMCEVCEHAPSSVTCKADAAALCVMCDWDIHSANPLARRHERIPVTPFYHSTVKSTAAPVLEAAVAPESDPNIITYEKCNKSTCHGHEESNDNNCWLPTNNSKLSADIQADMKSIEFLFSDPDNLLDFDYPVPNDPPNLYGGDTIGADSVVPVQIHSKPLKSSSVVGQSADNHFEIDFTTSNISSFNTSFTAQSMSQNIASDVAIVPEGSGISDTSYPYTLQMNNNVNNNNNGGSNGGSSGQVVSVAMDREARVMRYREKRKNRKFEKTIRYASRKAYAETRPRIKGRFAKRSENIEADVDNWFTSSPVTTNFIGNSGFGVVPSF